MNDFVFIRKPTPIPTPYPHPYPTTLADFVIDLTHTRTLKLLSQPVLLKTYVVLANLYGVCIFSNHLTVKLSLDYNQNINT